MIYSDGTAGYVVSVATCLQQTLAAERRRTLLCYRRQNERRHQFLRWPWTVCVINIFLLWEHCHLIGGCQPHFMARNNLTTFNTFAVVASRASLTWGHQACFHPICWSRQTCFEPCCTSVLYAVSFTYVNSQMMEWREVMKNGRYKEYRMKL